MYKEGLYMQYVSVRVCETEKMHSQKEMEGSLLR